MRKYLKLIINTGVEVENSFGQFKVGSDIILKPLADNTNRPLLEEGKSYVVKAQAVRIVENPIDPTLPPHWQIQIKVYRESYLLNYTIDWITCQLPAMRSNLG